MKKRILIADDTLPLRVMVEEVLTDAGYEVISASDGKTAWEILSSCKFNLDLVVLDLLMPGMSGFEVLACLKKELPDRKFPVLVISGVFKTDKEMLRLKELGANGYLSKTAVVDEILYRVNSIFFQKGPSAKRKHPRVIFNLPVEYQFNGTKHSSYTTTLSIGGCFVRTLKPANQSAIINLTLIGVKDNQNIITSGRVAWINTYDENRKPNTLPGMGVEFLEITPEQKETLNQIIEKKLKEESLWNKP